MNAGHNAFGGTLKDIRANALPRRACRSRPSVRQATFPSASRRRSSPTASICSAAARTTASPSSSRTSIAVFEAPLDEERSLAVIDAIVRLIPDKPIRWVINSHQHFDHVGGLRTYMHIGATIITHWKNYEFYNRDVLNYAPRTVEPDMVSLWPPTELAEGYYYEAIRENFVVSDGTRNLNIHYVNPLQHVEGMLIAYLPKEKLLSRPICSTRTGRGGDPTARPELLQRREKARAGRGPDCAGARRPVPWTDFAGAFKTGGSQAQEP